MLTFSFIKRWNHLFGLLFVKNGTSHHSDFLHYHIPLRLPTTKESLLWICTWYGTQICFNKSSIFYDSRRSFSSFYSKFSSNEGGKHQIFCCLLTSSFICIWSCVNLGLCFRKNNKEGKTWRNILKRNLIWHPMTTFSRFIFCKNDFVVISVGI